MGGICITSRQWVFAMMKMEKTEETNLAKSCCAEVLHPDYSAQIHSLNRVSGQVEGVKKMILARRYCPEILTQLRALRAAVHSIEANILETHLDSCVADAMKSDDKDQRNRKIAELKALYKKYNE